MAILSLDGVVCNVGDKLVYVKKDVCIPDDIPFGTVFIIRKITNNSAELISSIPHPKFHDIDGEEQPNTGVILQYQCIANYFMRKNKKTSIFKIKPQIMFKGQNLQGMCCRVLHSSKNNMVWIEVENDIGGCSCDGLGRKGHCISINYDCIAEE